ncbi:uncharacterized protein LOC129773979 [Toxorhynchites rutilus septentrionalis]|uniref:uncharacterized protein LOC129773979 n=1 Tax=Toxorhynchites rutilus septentrionalis TaxID=329112 RepID=UPI002478A417|nr:uncharacterized protein LOC129773979 [Toxorhynchites rutilus septentrionalis]
MEFIGFLNEQNIDIAIVTETHLKPEVNMYLPDFWLLRLDRTDSRGGGVAVILRRNIRCKLLPCFQLRTIEALGVDVSTSVGPITFIAAYYPRQTNVRDGSTATLKRDIVKLTRRRENFIIAGDLNAKHQAWGNSRRNQNGTVLAEDLQAAQYTILSPDSPTRLSRSGAHSTIDFFLINMANISNPVVYQVLSSDHYPVVAEVGSTIHRFQVSRRNYHHADWVRFRQCVDESIDYEAQPETTDDMDQCLHRINEMISRSRENNIPSSRQIVLSRSGRSRNPQPIPPLIPLHRPTDSNILLITPTEKAAEIGQHFVNSHNLGQHMISPHEATIGESSTILQTIPNVFPEESEISADELLTYIKSSKNMKAPGFDNILNLELKHLSPSFFNHLALIFNQRLRLGYFPSCWKSAKVIPIRKPGKDPTSPSSYRPISLLSGLSKLFEKAIYQRLLISAEGNNILIDEQFSFRKGRSTIHQLIRVTNILRRNKSVSKTSAMALFDVEKAFENVWHDGLVYKLQRYGLPIFLVKIIQSYLLDRTFRVSLNGSNSDAFYTSSGVPQGSILGPILFNLFTSVIPTLPDGGILSLFADDTSINTSPDPTITNNYIAI